MTDVLRCCAGAALICTGLAACQANEPAVIMSAKSPVELRVMQSRAFDTGDRTKTLRTVIATLQDLGYIIDKVDPGSGTVTATKLAMLKITASVYPRGTTQTVVRSNAMVKHALKDNQVDDPEFFQKLFFEPLSKAMFLTALQVEDVDERPVDASLVAPASRPATR